MPAKTIKLRQVKKSDQNKFKKALKNACIEKDIENAYRTILENHYGGHFVAKYATDGYLEPDKDKLLAADKTSLRLLLETKWQKNFEDGDRIKLIAQVVYYLKKFEQDGELLPNVVLGGDENEMFTIYAPKLYKYLERNYDWTIAPSSAFENEALYRELLEDENVRDVFVFRIDDGFDINDVIADINALSMLMRLTCVKFSMSLSDWFLAKKLGFPALRKLALLTQSVFLSNQFQDTKIRTFIQTSQIF